MNRAIGILRQRTRHRCDGRPLTLEIRNRLDHPLYTWPTTLLGWDVDFSSAPVTADRLLVTDGDGTPFPFQLSRTRTREGRLIAARVHVLADLPRGAVRRFHLHTTGKEAGAPRYAPRVHCSEEAEGFTIRSERLALRVPKAARSNGEGPAVGPILSLERNGRRFGASRLEGPTCGVLGLSSEPVCEGPLFIDWRLTYTFAGGRHYSATLRVVADYDFIRIREDMTGFNGADEAGWRLDWTGFEPTHHFASTLPLMHWRTGPDGWGDYAWRRIDQPHHVIYRGEDPPFMGPPRIGASGGDLPFRIGPYAPGSAYSIIDRAAFWDDRAGDAIGLFIDDPAQWDDGRYALWASAPQLQIRCAYAPDGPLSWHWPLATGSRSTCIACYDHALDAEAMDELQRRAAELRAEGIDADAADRLTRMPTTHINRLKIHYGTLHLDRVKEWQLHYPEGAARPPVVFDTGEVADADEFARRLRTSSLAAIATHGTHSIHAGTTYDPVRLRAIYDWITDGYNRLEPDMTPAQRERTTALLLLNAHVCADEDLMPMVTMLGGHPNFLADVKAPLAFAAFLFPEHPRAREWAEQFGKYIELNTRAHTRPDVPPWGTRGGRWTESPGIYVWAFLRPTVLAAWVLWKHFDGGNRMARHEVAELLEYLLGILTAPFTGEAPEHAPTPEHLHSARGPRRVYPPQGAHAKRRPPYRLLALLAVWMRRYRPLLAEHLLHVSRPDDVSQELAPGRRPSATWDIIYDSSTHARGTRPRLGSAKFTGYGVVLRAAVHQPDECSIHLQQIDPGPNYRWGFAGEGGCGAVYYYANGRAWSHNGAEDAGDRHCSDTDFVCTFGVWKDHRFRSIGMNDLTAPLIDLDLAQLARLEARQDAPYAWPEYRARNLLLVGADYFLLADDLLGEQVTWRFSWFVHRADRLPTIVYVPPHGEPECSRASGIWPHRTTRLQTDETHGLWHEGFGDSRFVISHRDDLRVESAPHGFRVALNGTHDRVFRSRTAIHVHEDDATFHGRTGVIRRFTDRTELVLIDGRIIAAGEIAIGNDGSGLAIAATYTRRATLHGVGQCPHAARLAVRARAFRQGPTHLYIDGARVRAALQDGWLIAETPAGRFRWECTDRLPLPVSPEVQRTVYAPEGIRIHFDPCPAADEHIVQTSTDDGASWKDAARGTTSPLHASWPVANGRFHVRLVALNTEHTAPAGPEYPAEHPDAPPDPPDGLCGRLHPQGIELQWGEVLGVERFRLYRRARAGGDFAPIHEGPHTRFIDDGAVGNETFEYVVTSINGFGEGGGSAPIDTDPDGWTNWDPLPAGGFRRHTTYTRPPYAHDWEHVPEYYPADEPRDGSAR